MTRVLWTCVLGLAATALGCAQPAPVIRIVHERPAEFPLPASVQRIGIAPLAAAPRTHPRWADLLAEELAHALTARDAGRKALGVVPAGEVAAALKAGRLAPAVRDASGAAVAARAADVDSILYGRVRVDVVRPRAAATDASRRVVTVTLTIEPAPGGGSIISAWLTGEHVPRGPDEAADLASADTASARAAARDLAERFADQLRPTVLVVQEQLRVADSDAVREGNRLAGAGRHAAALGRYREALAANDSDAAAAFNAGVMCEATGRLDEAARYYDIADAPRADPRARAARNRVRDEARARENR